MSKEIELWTVATGNLPLIPFLARKRQKEAILYIAEQDGFVGFAPIRPRGTLCLFDSENNAKGARNMMRLKGIKCGSNICKVYIDEEELKGAINERIK